MSSKMYMPKPVFDTLEIVLDQYKAFYADDQPRQRIRQWLNHCFQDVNKRVAIPTYASKDYQCVLNFLYSYRGISGTFVAYRRELERLLQWSWFVREQSLLKHKREDIEAFIEFCMKPHKRWIGLKKVSRFSSKDGLKVPNPEWRPFVVSLNKKDRRLGVEPHKDDYQFSQSALKVMFGILSSFYHFLLQEEITFLNPVALIRQKSKFLRKESVAPIIRRLSDEQWGVVIGLAQQQAEVDMKKERTVFILSCLYSLYLRISELVASDRWMPTMGDFFKDSDGSWWFKTVGKGHKSRQIAVSQSMLKALKRYRTVYLNAAAYPSPGEKTPLIGHMTNPNRPLIDTSVIRNLIQACFDQAADHLEKTDQHEAALLRTATVHWLRHTGISEDVKIRPREHVRDDAGHSSSAITDRYVDVELKERAKSARTKNIPTGKDKV